MTVREILVEWLKKHGYDGLYFQGVDFIECGCHVDDLILCDSYCCNCIPGVKTDRHAPELISPRKEKKPEEICRELGCSGKDERCPGNKFCIAVEAYKKNPVQYASAVAYMKKQINLTLQCSFCHGENSGECDHCGGSGIEPGKEI